MDPSEAATLAEAAWQRLWALKSSEVDARAGAGTSAGVEARAESPAPTSGSAVAGVTRYWTHAKQYVRAEVVAAALP